MTERDEKFPEPKDVEKEISEFLSEKFGGRVKLITPMVVPSETPDDQDEKKSPKKEIDFSLKPEQLEAYLDQYIVKQDDAKAVLATKICTHFNRIKHVESSSEDCEPILGNIKNNILMIGPTGVGKTYMIKLIAQKIGVPFVKGDATKFSETGYVGGDVEDLMRDIVREADDDINLAQYGIVYIDEIDKIASSSNLIGPDVSRAGVQRALLKPMEETDVDLKVPHDPISMLEELDRYRKTGKRKKRVVNTKNMLFIMSGAFNELAKIIKKRLVDQGIGFGAAIKSNADEDTDYLKFVKPEDLVRFGFETEFVGRLPVLSVFEKLTEDDLYAILKNPNNPVILSKKLDFKAYGIDVKFDDKALRAMAGRAFKEGTGARSLVSVIEKVLLKLEKGLPSSHVKRLAVTKDAVIDPANALEKILSKKNELELERTYDRLVREEKESIRAYVKDNQSLLTERYDMMITESRANLIAEVYCLSTNDINGVMNKIRDCYDQIKELMAYFRRSHELNVSLHEDATDAVVLEICASKQTPGDFYKKMSTDFQYGLKLVSDRTGKNDFVITKEALKDPDKYLNTLVKEVCVQDCAGTDESPSTAS
jgi:endopeptidase Clp ATP-binding regulatory subunit ClpX